MKLGSSGITSSRLQECPQGSYKEVSDLIVEWLREKTPVRCITTYDNGIISGWLNLRRSIRIEIYRPGELQTQQWHIKTWTWTTQGRSLLKLNLADPDSLQRLARFINK